MKKYILIFAAIALFCLALGACSGWEIEIRNPYDNISESSSSESSEESSEPEQESESEKLRVIGVSSKEIEADIINEDGFGLGRGSGIDFQWINETKALFFSYNIDDQMNGTGYSVRAFIYDDTEKEIKFIKEFNFDKTPGICVYTREQNARIVFSEVFSSFIYSVNYETFEEEEWREDIGIADISSKGLYAEIDGGSFAARDVEAREYALYVLDIPSGYDFESWSAKGGYALLQKGYDGGDYIVCRLNDGKTEEINVDGYAGWCGEEGFIAVYDYNEKSVEIIDFSTGESFETEYLENVISYEKDFSLFFSDSYDEILLRDNLTGKVFETGVDLNGGYGGPSARYNPENKTVLIETYGDAGTKVYSIKIHYGKDGDVPEIEPEPEREPKPDSDFGIEPAVVEDGEEYLHSEELFDDLMIFASWVGEKDFDSPKDVFSSYVLWWFGEELYEAVGEEEALYDDEQFFAVDVELAEKYFKRHFGMDREDVQDKYNFDAEAGSYKLPVSGGGPKNKFISAEVKSIEGNRIVYTVLLLIRQDETGKTFAVTEMTCDVFRDEEEMFLRLASNKVTEEFGEASFEDQAKYLTGRIVESLGGTYISEGIRFVNSQKVFEFICLMQKTIHLGQSFDRSSPYIGEFYEDFSGFHLPVSSMKKVAKEVFGIGNFEISPGEQFQYDEEAKEYVSGLEWGMGYGASATNLTTYVNGDIYTVRFSLMVIENVEGDPEWVLQDDYKMNFRLIDGEYLQFMGFDKA